MKRKQLFCKLTPFIGRPVSLSIHYDSSKDPIIFQLQVLDALILVNFLPNRFIYDFVIL